jgi:hypothetical protein
MSDLEEWGNAIELNAAYFEFSHPYQREKYRNTRAVGPMLVIKNLMYGELFAHLGSGKFEAWGFQINPTPSQGPVLIPAHCFMQRPNVDECDTDVITASGYRYDRVRVAEKPNVVIGEGSVFTPSDSSNSKPGRPSTYAPARESLLVLHAANPADIRKSAARLLEAFNEIYPKHAEAFGLPAIGLSERALRDHLKRFRQELAETGKNKSSI